MRILYWSPAFWPQIGGVEVIASHFLPAMQKRGHQFTVVTSAGSLHAASESDYHGTPIYRFPLWEAIAERNLPKVASIHHKLIAITRAFAPDVVHVNFFIPILFFFSRTAHVLPAPLLVSFRGTPPVEISEQETIARRVLCSASWVTTIAHCGLNAVRQLLPEIADRSSVIYNGMPLPNVHPQPLSFDPPCVLCLGRLVREKGFDLALRAVARVVQRFPSLQLLVAGDGTERASLERQAAELGLGDTVKFLGWVAPGRIPELINRATMVLMPSRWEGLPGVAIQAAQMARPVIGTRVSGLPEVVLHDETGLLTETEDDEALADAIALLIDHPAKAIQFGEAARKRAQTVFGWNRYLDQYETVYQRLKERMATC